MNHPAPEDLQPTGALADRAPDTATYEAFDVHFSRRFGEREVARPQPGLHVLAVQPPCKRIECPFQISEGDVVSDCQAFHLIELDFRSSGDLLVAVTHPREDHPYRLGCALAHDPDLPWRGVCPQKHSFVFGVKRVPLVARRVIWRDVEQTEVVVIRLNIPRTVDLEPNLRPDVGD